MQLHYEYGGNTNHIYLEVTAYVNQMFDMHI